MSRRTDRIRNGVATTVVVVLGLTTAINGVVRGDVLMTFAGVLVVVAVPLVLGPLMRWYRRGEGPHPMRGSSDDDREAYLRLRHNGGNSTGH